MYLDVGNPFPFPDATFDFVFSEHLFEHLTYMQGINMLKESHRIFKPGGVIRIATPNLEFLVDLYLHPASNNNKDYILFDSKRSGLPPHPVYAINRFHTQWGHQIIYDQDSLTNLLKGVGFTDIVSCEVGESRHPDLLYIENHSKYLGETFNCLQTMVLEAVR